MVSVEEQLIIAALDLDYEAMVEFAGKLTQAERNILLRAFSSINEVFGRVPAEVL